MAKKNSAFGSTNQMFTSGLCPSVIARAFFDINLFSLLSNGLIINFDFRVFMFQEMLSGDSIMISAKVIACVEEIDCAPVSVFCLKP